MVLNIEALKKLFGKNSREQDLIDTLTPIKDTKVSSSGTEFLWRIQGFSQAKGYLATAETAINLGLKDFGSVANLVVVPGTTVTITISGGGLKFVDMDSLAAPADSVDISCANLYNEISISDSGERDSSSRVLLVVKK